MHGNLAKQIGCQKGRNSVSTDKKSLEKTTGMGTNWRPLMITAYNSQKSAEERYIDFRDNYPEIESRVPQHALASYLGMSQEYLSKIRHKLAGG